MPVTLKNDINSWGIVARLFHWISAFLLIGLLYVGLIMVDMVNSPEKFDLYRYHKSLGILVLGLIIMRLMWRWINITPTLPTPGLASRLSAPVLYMLMLIMPVSGMIMSQAGGHPISFFGWFNVPILLEKNPSIGKLAWQIHGYTGKILIGVIALHFMAAFYHQWILKNNLLRRMIKGH
ncbi:MAG: cytochrome b [Candidatus Paracaedibacteraceae bacterium]|nr:cytochrome b [Candidatus Paracaedibacteraceae bacterium]